MLYHFNIIAKAHFLQSDKEVLITEKGSFLGIYKRLRHLEKRDSIEIDCIYIEAVTKIEK